MQIAWRFRQCGQIGHFSNGKFVNRLAEIVQRCGRNSVVAEAEINLVQIKLENPVFGIGCLDPEAQQHLANFAFVGALIGEQEVFCHLLRDG